MEYYLYQIGKNVKMLRERLNLSQKELANKIDVSESTISVLERNGRAPSTETLIALCLFFKVSPSFLLSMGEFDTSSKNLHSLEFYFNEYLLQAGLTSSEIEFIKGSIDFLAKNKLN